MTPSPHYSRDARATRRSLLLTCYRNFVCMGAGMRTASMRPAHGRDPVAGRINRVSYSAPDCQLLWLRWEAVGSMNVNDALAQSRQRLPVTGSATIATRSEVTRLP